MCGILCILGVKPEDFNDVKTSGLKNIRLLRHRGPDWGGMKTVSVYKKKMNDSGSIAYAKMQSHFLFHERLSIVGVNSGAQPIVYNDVCVSVNGEIYNHMDLKNKHFGSRKFNTSSDCEIIAHLFNLFIDHNYYTLGDIPAKLDGQFAFVAVKKDTNQFLIARDPLGIAPLYYGFDHKNNLWVSSELKAIHKVVINPIEFPPGHYLTSKHADGIQRYYNPNWWGGNIPKRWLYNKSTIEEAKLSIEQTLVKAVKKRMMADVQFGVLLSGGLDSSLISSIVVKNSPTKVKSFSIGLKDSPDLVAAQQVAEYLGTEHHSIVYSLDEGLYALNDVIYHLETYDITTIRAGTPMYLLSRVIKAMGIKMVLSGEGADECMGGYLYFHKAPNDIEFFKETCRKLEDLHYYDVLRANKATMAWGVEVRVPFLDKEFLDLVMNIDPAIKKPLPSPVTNKPVEKYLLRSSFDSCSNEYLPTNVLWRQKEQFSDGVGYSWIDTLKERTGHSMSDKQFELKKNYYKHNPPQSKEGCYYRDIYSEHYPWNCEKLVPDSKTIACSSSVAAEWDAKWIGKSEASGRIVDDVHDNSNVMINKL